MESPKPTISTLSVDDIAAMSDAELALFMDSNRCADDSYNLPIDGWDKLSTDERAQLAERLKRQERALAQSPLAFSRQLDLGQLDARLLAISTEGNSSSLQTHPRAIERSRSPTEPIDEEAEVRHDEAKAYHDLLSDGGRPLYTIDLLEQVLSNPDEYRDMLRPWRFTPRFSEPWPELRQVFRSQFKRWEAFRKWQRDNRGLEDDDDGGFPAYVERQKLKGEQEIPRTAYIEWLAGIEADPSSLKRAWDRQQRRREWQRDHYRERGCDNFDEYAKAVKNRLEQHHFTQPFHLEEDPKQQDALTTWTEYLNFEYWWLDRYTRSFERLKPAHDQAWAELVDSKVLVPDETQESVRTDASSMQLEREIQRAVKAVESANSEAERIYTLTQEDSQRLQIPESKRISMRQDATAALKRAREQLQEIKRGADLILAYIRGTFDYETAKKDIARQGLLLPWVLEQLPLIEAETIQSGVGEAQHDRTQSKKRSLDSDKDHPTERTPKRQKFEPRKLRSHSRISATVQSEAQETHPEAHMVMDQDEPQGAQTEQPTTRRSPRSVDGSQTMPQGLRRSARIAARRQAN
ncbi:Fc.00g034830.m01.CDS01 [Cosmosporella sp. VM-42]